MLGLQASASFRRLHPGFRTSAASEAGPVLPKPGSCCILGVSVSWGLRQCVCVAGGRGEGHCGGWLASPHPCLPAPILKPWWESLFFSARGQNNWLFRYVLNITSAAKRLN